MLDGLLDAVQRAGVHGRLPGGGLGLRLEPHLKEGEGTRGNETWISREGITLRTVTEVVRSWARNWNFKNGIFSSNFFGACNALSGFLRCIHRRELLKSEVKTNL